VTPFAFEPAPSLTGPIDRAVKSGDVTNDVFAAPLSVTGAPIRVPLIGGRVSHEVDPKTGAIANITAAGLHTLNPGYIIRWIEQGPGGVLMSRTLGRGTGGFARENEILGARLFGETDQRIRERLK